jgi:hypothetical protein
MKLLSQKKYDLLNGFSLVIVETDKFGETAALFQHGNPLWAGALETLKSAVGAPERLQ